MADSQGAQCLILSHVTLEMPECEFCLTPSSALFPGQDEVSGAGRPQGPDGDCQIQGREEARHTGAAGGGALTSSYPIATPPGWWVLVPLVSHNGNSRGFRGSGRLESEEQMNARGVGVPRALANTPAF